MRWPQLLMAMYAIGVAVMLCRLLWGLVYLHRLQRASTRADDSLVLLFDDCCETQGVRSATLSVHPDVASPIVCGLLQPGVIVPADFSDRPQSSQRACLIHELTHIRRGDHWALLLTELIKAGFFFHPLVHWLTRRLNLEREFICDEAALRADADQRQYAADLLDFGQRTSRLPSIGAETVAMPFGRRSTIKVRVTRLLTDFQPVQPLSSRRVLLLTIVVMVMSGLFGALRFEAAAGDANEPAQPVAAAEPEASPEAEETSDQPVAKVRPQIRIKYTPEEGPGYGIEYHPVTVTGTAVGPDGQPLAGASVWLASGVVTVDKPCPQTTTDEQGRFQFTDVDVEVRRHRESPVPKPTEGKYTVFGAVSGYGFTWHPLRSYRPYPRPDGVDPGDTDAITTQQAFYAEEPMDVTLRFEPPARVRGRLLDDFGRPVADASVEFGHVRSVRSPYGYGMYSCQYLGAEGDRQDSFTSISALPRSIRATRTDADGYFELNQLRRDTKYLALIDPGPEYDPLGFDLITREGDSERRSRYVGYDGEFSETCAAPRDVQVRVVGADSDQPLAGVSVIAHGRRVLRAGGSASTDESGTGTLRLIPGEYTLFIEPPFGQAWLGTTEKFTVVAESDANALEVGLSPAATVLLKVVDATTGEPRAGVSFEYETDSSKVRHTLHSLSSYADFPRTDAQGELRAVVAPGRRRFFCLADPKAAADNGDSGDFVELTPGTETTVQFQINSANVEPDEDEIADPQLQKLAQHSIQQREMLDTVRARLSVKLSVTNLSVPFTELESALNELSPDKVPDLPVLMQERFDQEFRMPRVDITVDGNRRRGEFHQSNRRTGEPMPPRVDVITERLALFYSPASAQADVNDRRTGRRGSNASFPLCRWPAFRSDSAVTMQDDTVVLEMTRDDAQMTSVLNRETGFLYRLRYSQSGSGRAVWQFAPRTFENGLVLPGIVIDVRFRNDEVDLIRAHLMEDVQLVDSFPPDTFAMALPPGVNVLDWRNVPRNGPRRPDAGVIRGPVRDIVTYLDWRQPRYRPVEPVIEYGTPAPALNVAHWFNADGPTAAPDMQGKVVLIDFWGTTCGPCLAELDELRAAHKHIASDRFLLIGLHDADGTVEELVEFAQERKLNYQLAIDNEASEQGWFGATTQAFGARGIPTAMVIDAEGNSVYLGQLKQALVQVGRLLNDEPSR